MSSKIEAPGIKTLAKSDRVPMLTSSKSLAPNFEINRSSTRLHKLTFLNDGTIDTICAN